MPMVIARGDAHKHMVMRTCNSGHVDWHMFFPSVHQHVDLHKVTLVWTWSSACAHGCARLDIVKRPFAHGHSHLHMVMSLCTLSFPFAHGHARLYKQGHLPHLHMIICVFAHGDIVLRMIMLIRMWSLQFAHDHKPGCTWSWVLEHMVSSFARDHGCVSTWSSQSCEHMVHLHMCRSHLHMVIRICTWLWPFAHDHARWLMVMPNCTWSWPYARVHAD